MKVDEIDWWERFLGAKILSLELTFFSVDEQK
jgi:hypothetical protein